MARTIWDEVIKEYQGYGFSIKYPNVFELELYFKDKKIATLFRDKITADNLRQGCENYLRSLADAVS